MTNVEKVEKLSGRGNDGLGQELTKELSEKVLNHRDNFHHFLVGRYLEGLATLFFYDFERPFDKARLEIALRQGYGVAVGPNRLGQTVILGTTMDVYGYNTMTSMNALMYQPRLTGKDINWTLPPALRPENYKLMKEIVNDDNAKSGSFVIFHNKPLVLTSDFSIIEYYADELAEIVASRFSLVMQSKIMTVITGEVGDESANQLVSSLYNGNPFVKVGKLFDIEDNIIHIDNPSLAQNLQELKTEYQHKIAELNSLFGINVLAVDKESGVTDSEANGNLAYTTMNGNIYLECRQQSLDLYNRHYGTHYSVRIDSNAVGEIGDGGAKNENNLDS